MINVHLDEVIERCCRRNSTCLQLVQPLQVMWRSDRVVITDRFPSPTEAFLSQLPQEASMNICRDIRDCNYDGDLCNLAKYLIFHNLTPYVLKPLWDSYSRLWIRSLQWKQNHALPQWKPLSWLAGHRGNRYSGDYHKPEITIIAAKNLTNTKWKSLCSIRIYDFEQSEKLWSIRVSHCVRWLWLVYGCQGRFFFSDTLSLANLVVMPTVRLRLYTKTGTFQKTTTQRRTHFNWKLDWTGLVISWWIYYQLMFFA